MVRGIQGNCQPIVARENYPNDPRYPRYSVVTSTQRTQCLQTCRVSWWIALRKIQKILKINRNLLSPNKYTTFSTARKQKNKKKPPTLAGNRACTAEVAVPVAVLVAMPVAVQTGSLVWHVMLSDKKSAENKLIRKLDIRSPHCHASLPFFSQEYSSKKQNTFEQETRAQQSWVWKICLGEKYWVHVFCLSFDRPLEKGQTDGFRKSIDIAANTAKTLNNVKSQL